MSLLPKKDLIFTHREEYKTSHHKHFAVKDSDNLDNVISDLFNDIDNVLNKPPDLIQVIAEIKDKETGLISYYSDVISDVSLNDLFEKAELKGIEENIIEDSIEEKIGFSVSNGKGSGVRDYQILSFSCKAIFNI